MVRSVRIAALVAAISMPALAYAALETTGGPTAPEVALTYTYVRGERHSRPASARAFR
jgi:hypothetical protein